MLKNIHYSLIGIIIVIVGVWQLIRVTTTSPIIPAAYKSPSSSSSSSSPHMYDIDKSGMSVSDFDHVIEKARDLIEPGHTHPHRNIIGDENVTPAATSRISAYPHISDTVKTSRFSITDLFSPLSLHPPSSIEGLENKYSGEQLEEYEPVNMASINQGDVQSKFKLKDYYIKTAYNCCNTGSYKNDNVNLSQLKYVIKRGCRCLDFEIYSVDNKPVIASSSVNTFNYKETFNHIPFNDALEVITTFAFSNSKCPNPQDPLILHIRFMSANRTMYNTMAEIMTKSKSLGPLLMGPQYARENHNKDFGNIPLLSLKGKIIIMADATNPIFRETKLNEFINMSSNTLFLSKKTFYEVATIGDTEAFKEANKKYMSFVLPERSGKPVNKSPVPAMDSWGCQMVAMCFNDSIRQGDDLLKLYEDKFNSSGYAFILKPEELRYVPIVIKPPTPANPAHSYKDRATAIPGGTFHI